MCLGGGRTWCKTCWGLYRVAANSDSSLESTTGLQERGSQQGDIHYQHASNSITFKHAISSALINPLNEGLVKVIAATSVACMTSHSALPCKLWAFSVFRAYSEVTALAVRFCTCWLLKVTPSTVSSWVLGIFSKSGGMEVSFLLGWWTIISYDLFGFNLRLLAQAHWVMLLSSLVCRYMQLHYSILQLHTAWHYTPATYSPMAATLW